ncbi:hypothetical protein [Caldisericum sp.]|jgi:hypothetical protein|uniref:hypothetical protein n=1 Tax=Caldisericum sp. TaxID=2499687 RepID=UPI003D12DA39
MNSIEDRFEKILDDFLNEKPFLHEKLSQEEAELFEIALLLKDKKVDPTPFKEKIFENTFTVLKEETYRNNNNVLSVLAKFFELLFDASPFNNNEHLTFDQVYRTGDKIFYKIKFYSYLQSRQFLYNYIWSLQVPLGLETLH